MLPLMACEGFPALDSRDSQPPAPVFLEPPAPAAAEEPRPEKPLPPLPAAKPPVRSVQARPEQPPGDAGESDHAAAAEPPPVVGLNRSALVEQFGSPVAEREAAPARVIEFASDDCRLAAYLYFDTARNDFYVLQYQVNGMTERNDAADRCLKRIRDAAHR